jgi:hypothetical protein
VVGEANHGDLEASDLLDDIALEDRLVPFLVGHVVGDDREVGLLDQREQVLLRVEEFPVPGRHDLVADGVHDLHHRNALIDDRESRAVPGVAGVDQQGRLRFLGAQPLDEGGSMGHAADFPFVLRLLDVVTLAGLRPPGLHLVQVAVIDRAQVAVDVVGADDPELLLLGVCDTGPGQLRNEQQGRQCREAPAARPEGATS